MIRKISSSSSAMVILSTIDHEIKCSNQVSCHLSFGEITREKDDKKMVSGSNTMVMHSTFDCVIKGSKPTN
jgi:hypothetical protein